MNTEKACMQITRRFFLFLILAIQFALLSAGCDKPAEQSRKKSAQKSPGETVKAFYMAGNEGKYAEVEQYLSSGVLKLLKSPSGTSDEAMKRVMKQATRNRTIEKIEISKEEMEGGKSVVYYTLHFKDSTKEDGNKILVKEKDRWKLTTW